MKDAQRQRVYDAETVAQRTLKELGIIKTPVVALSIAEMQTVLQKMSLYDINVGWFPKNADHCAYFDYNKSIKMIPSMATLWNIVHEGCHALVHRSYPDPWKMSNKMSYHYGVWCDGENNPIEDVVGHGWHFANQLLCQIRNFFGDVAADCLEGAYKKLGVKYLAPEQKRKYTHKKPINTYGFTLEAWNKMTATQKNIARYEEKKRQAWNS